jgi:hypothetical protein
MTGMLMSVEEEEEVEEETLQLARGFSGSRVVVCLLLKWIRIRAMPMPTMMTQNLT